MRGSVKGQVNHIWQHSGINQLGTSKHESRAQIRAELKAAGDNITKHNQAKTDGIHGNATRDTYCKPWRELLNDQKAEYGKADADKLTAQDVERYLAEKIEMGLSRAYVQKLCSALEKMETSLNMLADREGRPGGHDWQQTLQDARDRAQRELDKDRYDRSYRDPKALTDAIRREDHQLVAKIQLEGGARVAEASTIHARQLAGLHQTRQGETVGVYCVHGKNGKIRAITVSPATYRELEAHIAAKGKLHVDYDRYRDGLKEAAQATGQHKIIEIKGRTSGQPKTVQDWGGTHGLRYNFAQASYRQHIDGGMAETEALSRVSYEMGHNRADITRLYLEA